MIKNAIVTRLTNCPLPSAHQCHVLCCGGCTSRHNGQEKEKDAVKTLDMIAIGKNNNSSIASVLNMTKENYDQDKIFLHGVRRGQVRIS